MGCQSPSLTGDNAIPALLQRALPIEPLPSTVLQMLSAARS